MKIDTDKLVDANGLLEALFDEGCRPTVRWLRNQQKNRAIPYIKVGHLVFFDIVQVRQAFEKKNTVRARLGQQ